MANLSVASVCDLLEHGEVELKGQFMLGSNYTFLVTVRHAGEELAAVYKPTRGEQPLWDFPPASLTRREAAAWLLSEALGWELVPPTVLRADGPYGPGSLQRYIDYNPNHHYFNFKPADRQRLQPVALFDLLANNADRKGSHVFFQKRTRHLYAIDHGLCFHAEDKLRTVIWDFAGQPFPAELLDRLRSLQEEFEPLASGLADLLTPGELEALKQRLNDLLNKPVYPSAPEDRRAFPYPPL
jgi:uncharacterized repeat protein (TIGR03843 family)